MELWEQATALHGEGKYAEAEELYDKLLTQNPTNPGLLATLGTMYLTMNKVGLAIALLEASIKNGSRQSDVYSNLGLAYKYAGLPEKAMAALRESMKGKNPSAKGIANFAGMFVEAGDPQRCIDLCKKSLKLEPDLALAHWNLSLVLLGEGRWAEGWDEYEWGMRDGGMRVERAIGGLPQWDGTPGKTVAVYGEQGLGDEILFASMLPDLMKTNTVVLECHPRLVTLFQNSFPGLKVYGTRKDDEIHWLDDQPLDYQISIGSLGKFYRRSREAFPGTPYLKADSLPRGDKFRVGISWTGGMKAGRILKRTVPLSWWKSILDVRDVEFVSLQYTDCKDEIDAVNALGYDIKVMDEYVKAEDYNETARLVKSCDLVISVATSVYHLAGALGVPAWVMVPNNPPWREQRQGGIPWYRSVRAYRQPESEADAWIPVVERVGLDLDDLVSARRQKAA